MNPPLQATSLSFMSKSLLLVALLTPCQALAAFWGRPQFLQATISHTAATDGDLSGAWLKTADILSLDSIRSTLIRQEETIIFSIIERAQFRRNAIIYEKGAFETMDAHKLPNLDNLSFFEYMFIETEALHSKARRYTSPEEHAFFPELLPADASYLLPSLEYPENLLSDVGGASGINFNEILLKKYIDVIIPSITDPGDDEQHGSTALNDIHVLQALSRRVHYGKFVAESKYRSDPEAYQRLVDAGDADGVMRLLTNEEVEKNVIRRAGLKAATYGTEPLLASLPDVDDSDIKALVAAAAASAVVATLEATSKDGHPKGKVDHTAIETLYRDIIIPMTKDIEVAYLFLRCGRTPPPEYAPDRMSRDVLSDYE